MNQDQYEAIKIARRALNASNAHLTWSISESYCVVMHQQEQAQLAVQEDALAEIDGLLGFWERNNA